jgi:hypothetical protein
LKTPMTHSGSNRVAPQTGKTMIMAVERTPRG